MIRTGKKKGFTLIELLVVVAIIGVLATIVLSSLNVAQSRARDARRVSDMRNILTAFNLYLLDHNGLARTSDYGESDTGGWDMSNIGGFLTFLSDGGYMSKVPVDPLNNGDYYYQYYCYTGTSPGLVMRYRQESNEGYRYAQNNFSTSSARNPEYPCGN